MIQATRKDKPQWFSRPRNITSATICRLSGKLATDSCRDVVSADGTGTLTRRSMAYSENFVVGTEPTDSCPIHGRVLGGAIRALAALMAPRSAPSPQPGVTPQPPGVAANDTPQPPKAEPEPSPRKRGFWSRVFGVGKDKKDDRK
jgi:hypothetical protein